MGLDREHSRRHPRCTPDRSLFQPNTCIPCMTVSASPRCPESLMKFLNTPPISSDRMLCSKNLRVSEGSIGELFDTKIPSSPVVGRFDLSTQTQTRGRSNESDIFGCRCSAPPAGERCAEESCRTHFPGSVQAKSGCLLRPWFLLWPSWASWQTDRRERRQAAIRRILAVNMWHNSFVVPFITYSLRPFPFPL